MQTNSNDQTIRKMEEKTVTKEARKIAVETQSGKCVKRKYKM